MGDHVRNKAAAVTFMLLLAILARLSWAQTAQCQTGGTANILAPWYCSQMNQAITDAWQQWEPVAIITVALSFLIAVMIFMVGIAMRNEGLRNFGVGELYEASATALIAILFLTVSAILFGIIPGLFVGPINPYVTALTYISNTITATQKVIESLFNLVVIFSYLGSINLRIAPGVFSITLFLPFVVALTSLFIMPVQVIMSLLADGIAYLSFEFYLILFLMYIAVPVFLIPGIILRAIFPLRGLGGVLIAMALAFYLIMPVLFSVIYYFTNTSLIGTLNAAAAMITANGAGSQAIANAASPAAPLVTQVSGLESSMGAYFMAILLYPAIVMGIIYTAIVEISGFLGVAVRKTKRFGVV